MNGFLWNQLKQFLSWAHIWTGQQTFTDINVTGGSIAGAVITDNFTTSTDPAIDAAVSTAIVDAYNGIIITLTAAGNAQALQAPTASTVKRFVVINNDTSTHSIIVNGITLAPGKGQTFVYDGSAWGPSDIGITSIPVPITEGGTGKVSALDAINNLAATGVSIGGTASIKGPAIINSGFAGTVTAANSTTVTFSSAADAILAGYSATNPILGTTRISNALTRNIVSWTNATTCVVDTDVTWAGTAITSVQLPVVNFQNSSGEMVFSVAGDDKIILKTAKAQLMMRFYDSGGYRGFYGTGGGYLMFAASIGNELAFYSNGVTQLRIDIKGNFITGGIAAAGTNAAKVLAIGSGTAPTTSPADAAQMWVADSNSVAGAAALHMRNEVGKSGAVAFKTLTTKTVSSTPVTLTANEIADGLILVTTGASVINLPAGDASLDGAPVKFRTIAAVAFSTKPNGVQVIDLAGTDLTGGNKITSDGTAGVEYTLVWDNTASKWRTLSISGVVVDGGA